MKYLLKKESHLFCLVRFIYLFFLGSHCVFCPNDHTFPCLVVPGVGEEECTGGMGCELPDGRVVFGLSEEDCR